MGWKYRFIQHER